MNIRDFEVNFFDELDSTNKYAKEFIDNQSNNDCTQRVFVADYQTNGRGAFQNKWESEKGKNLTFSLVIFPKISPKDQFIISKITSLAIVHYIAKHNLKAKIKWPNDILVVHKKISGILIENSVMGNSISSSIVGIGININQTVFSESLNATSLKKLKENEFDKNKELQIFINSFNYYYQMCKDNKFEKINQEYFNFLYGKNEFMTYKKDEEFFEAKIENIDEYGRLILKNKLSELMTFGFKEVELIISKK